MNSNLTTIPKDFNPPITATSYLTRKCLLKYIRKYATQLTGSIMDFGCGSKPYRSLFNVNEYIGVDFKGEGHSHENEIIDAYYDGITIPFEENRFDGIFSSEVFEHIFNLDHILPELYRVLKPGGKLFITCPFVISEHEIPNDFARYTSYGLKDLLQRNGFDIIAFEKAGSSIETMYQVLINYLNYDIIRKYLEKIPILRAGVRTVFITLLNLAAVILNWILPKGKDLYLNNIVLAIKK